MSFIIFIFIAFIKVIKTAERFGLSRETVFGSSTEAGLRWLAGSEVGRLAGKKRRRGWQEETVKLLNLHIRAPDEVRGARGRAGPGTRRGSAGAIQCLAWRTCRRPVLAHVASWKHHGTWNLGAKAFIPKSLCSSHSEKHR